VVLRVRPRPRRPHPRQRAVPAAPHARPADAAERGGGVRHDAAAAGAGPQGEPRGQPQGAHGGGCVRFGGGRQGGGGEVGLAWPSGAWAEVRGPACPPALARLDPPPSRPQASAPPRRSPPGWRCRCTPTSASHCRCGGWRLGALRTGAPQRVSITPHGSKPLDLRRRRPAPQRVSLPRPAAPAPAVHAGLRAQGGRLPGPLLAPAVQPRRPTGEESTSQPPWSRPSCRLQPPHPNQQPAGSWAERCSLTSTPAPPHPHPADLVLPRLPPGVPRGGCGARRGAVPQPRGFRHREGPRPSVHRAPPDASPLPRRSTCT
jgi:hypothetical protein